MGVLIRGGGMGWRRVRPGQTALGGTGQQQAKAKSLFHVRLRVTGLQADGQAAAQRRRRGGRVYKEAVKDTSEEKGSVQDAGGGIEVSGCSVSACCNGERD